MDRISIIAQVATTIIAVLTFYMLREAVRSRLSSVKPIIIPSRESDFNGFDKLFIYNYMYPVTEFEYHGIAHFVIKNIGKGPACNVKIDSVKGDWEEIEFRIGDDNNANIPEESSIPVILRVGFTDTDFEYGRLTIRIMYEDILGKTYYFTVDLWLREIQKIDDFTAIAIPIRYHNCKKKDWVILDSVIFREIENTGYYELEEISQRINVT